MKPFQYKMSTGAIYVGFPGEVGGDGMFPLVGACAMNFISTEGRYDVRNIMLGHSPIDVNKDCVQVRQVIDETSDVGLAYCRYLGTLIAMIEDEGREIPKAVIEYVSQVNEYFRSQFDGVSIELSGQYDFACIMGNTSREESLRKEMSRIAREFKKEGLTESESSCQPNVVHLQFGSGNNAQKKGED